MSKLYYFVFLFLISCNPVYTKISKEKDVTKKIVIGSAGNTSGIYRSIGFYVDTESNDTMIKWEYVFPKPDSIVLRDNLILANNRKKYFFYFQDTGYYYRVKKTNIHRINKIKDKYNIPDSVVYQISK